MDKNSIKKYAVWARNELIARVAQKANQYGITEAETISASADSIHGKLLTPTEKKQRTALIEKIKNKGKNGFQLVMEEVAYTWFNRFTAIRFMEVNGYLPSHVRVFTDEENHFAPQILAEAIHLDMPGLDMEKVFELKQANNTEELYKYLIITQCNALNEILPGMFQRIEDYTELLLPDNLLREGSVIEQMITLIPEEDWTDQVQIIGWLYQYYNIEPKDAVFANLKKSIKIPKEKVPAATQIFTPDWIVRYMVENSLGRLWVEGHPNDELKANWKYYLDEAEQDESVKVQLDVIRREYANIKPEEIKVIDPCMGSGHILCYMFDVLVQIYEAYGYTARDAVASIVENNIYGLDIDDRASQLAYFAVMMKARQYDRRFFSRGIKPNVYAIVESNEISNDTIDYFVNGDEQLKKELNIVLAETKDAKEYGSALVLRNINFEALNERSAEIVEDVSLFRQAVIDDLIPLIKVAFMLQQKYDIVVTNPPYMGNKGFSDKLLDFITKYYYESKIDLFAVFIQRCSKFTKENGIYSLITPDSWMFLSRFEKLRLPYLSQNTFSSIVHMGFGAFDGGFGTVAFVGTPNDMPLYNSTCLRLVDALTDKETAFLSAKPFMSNKARYKKVIGNPICYWASDKLLESFDHETIKETGSSCVGLVTGDNEQFIRDWYEIDFTTLGTGLPRDKAIIHSSLKWFPINQSGDYRKWYGNNINVFDWWHDGYNIKKFKLDRYLRGETEKKNSKCWNEESYFHEGLTWSRICTDRFSARYSEIGCTAGTTCPIYFPKTDSNYILGLLNSKVILSIVAFLNPTVSFQAADIERIPIIIDTEKHNVIESLVEQQIQESKLDWDAFETSWNYESHPFVKYSKSLWDATAIGATMGKYYGRDIPKHNSPLELCYLLWKGECEERFATIKANEEELNRLFIEIYGLQDELTPEVDEKDVTVRKSDLDRDVRSFISYAVGCMFGRYSLNVDGIAYAGGEWDEEKYISFKADKDNVLPICDDEYFEDDIVGKFVKFVEVVYGKDSLEANLKFISDALGGNGSSRDVIRSYFLNDFYADHLKIYQKRPIYWQFDSGKKNGFKCLIYMHRYQPDTIARIRTDYVHEQQARYRTAIADLEQRIQVATTSERVKLTKLLQKLKDQETEIRLFEEKIHHLADQMIRINLDDGVKHNYEIFKDVLTKIK